MSSSSTGSSLGGGVDAAFPTSTASSWDFEKSNTTEAVIDAAVLQSPTEDVSELMIPDGGVRAWLIVFGAMCNNFSTFGLINSWGTFQAYYEENLLSDSSPSSIAWIGSVQYSLTFLPGLLAGRLFDLGYFRHMISTSSILIVVATFLIPECKEYWQFLLCQGFAVGIGSGGIYSANVAVIAHWFKLRRGLVMGWTTAGSAVGGIFFPVVIRALLQNVGFSWCMRILGFILMATLGMANLTLRTRLPPSNGSLRGLLDGKLLSSVPYLVYCLSGFTSYLGLYTVLTFLNSSAVFYGVLPGFAIYLTAIANGASGVSRLLVGRLSDRVGPLNMIIPFTLVAAALTYAWPFARNEGASITIAVIYGFSSGAYVALIVNPIFAMGSTADVGRRVGFAITMQGLGALVGPPISGAIERTSGGFPAAGYYAGSVVVVAATQMFLSRQLLLDWKLWGKI